MPAWRHTLDPISAEAQPEYTRALPHSCRYGAGVVPPKLSHKRSYLTRSNQLRANSLSLATPREVTAGSFRSITTLLSMCCPDNRRLKRLSAQPSIRRLRGHRQASCHCNAYSGEGSVHVLGLA